MHIKKVSVSNLQMAAYNPRKNLMPDDPEYQRLKASMGHFGYVDPIIWNERTGNVVGGHQRLKILISQGNEEVDVSAVDLSMEDEKALNIALNKISGEWDYDKLEIMLAELAEAADFDETLTGFDISEIEDLIAEDDTVYFRDKLEPGGGGTLFEAFVIPPFSVFDTRQGYWQDRKNHWIDFGIRS